MILIIILSIIFTLIDQISKILIIKFLDFNSSLELIKKFFYLTYTNNTGAAFSILTGKRVLLIIVALLIIIFLFNYLRKEKPKKMLDKIAFSLVIGGSIGNLIDRIIRGYVVDFFQIKIFKYNFPIFNVADTFITIGIILLMITTFRRGKNDYR